MRLLIKLHGNFRNASATTVPDLGKFTGAVCRLFSQGADLLLFAGWDKSLGSSGLILRSEVLLYDDPTRRTVSPDGHFLV